jgi:hypothetical protein
MCPYHFDQSNRDIGTVKFRLTSRTWRANVDVTSLETVRSPAVMRLSEPGIAPLSRAYPRLNECRPFRTLASLRDQTQRFSTTSRPNVLLAGSARQEWHFLLRRVDDMGRSANWLAKLRHGGYFVAGTKVTVSELPYSVARCVSLCLTSQRSLLGWLASRLDSLERRM